MTVLGEECRVGLFDSFLYMRGFHTAMVYEQQQCGFLDVIVGVGNPAGSLKAPAGIKRGDLYEFVGDGTTVYLTNAVDGRCLGRNGNGCTGVAMLLAREGHAGRVDCVAANHVDDLVELVRGRSESLASGGNIVEEIFDRELGTVPACSWLGIRRLTRLRGSQPAAIVMSTPCTI
jgi:hypothetical protein